MADEWDTELFQYSEWLDSQGVILSEEDSGDGRSHEQLVRDFIAQRPADAPEVAPAVQY